MVASLKEGVAVVRVKDWNVRDIVRLADIDLEATVANESVLLYDGDTDEVTVLLREEVVDSDAVAVLEFVIVHGAAVWQAVPVQS